MSSSDTSSEENLDLLMEAVDGQFMNDFMFASRGTGDTEKGGYQQIWRWLWNVVHVGGWTKYLVHQSFDDVYKYVWY